MKKNTNLNNDMLSVMYLLKIVILLIFRITIFLVRLEHHNPRNRIDGVMVSMLTSSAIDHGFKPRTGQTKDYNIGVLLLHC